jgi:hypothetical protein
MIRTIASTARISTKIIKDGSVAGRDAYCKELENNFFNRIEKYKRSQFDYIGKNINKILPTKLIQVEKLSLNKNIYTGAVMLASDSTKIIPADIVGYIVALKPQKIKEHFGGVSIGVLMHEMHHLFNYFTHPKIPNRIYKVSKIPAQDTNFEKFFVDNFQSPLLPSKCETKTEQLLKNFSTHKSDILQFFRYKLIDEIGAYYIGEKFANLHRSKLLQKQALPLESLVDVLYLREKLVMITDMLKTVLKSERNNLHKSHKTIRP